MSLARRTLQITAFLCTLIVGAAAMALIVTQTTWFKEWLRGFIVRQAEDYVNGRLSIGRLDGNLFFGVKLGDVDITQNGESVVNVKDVGVDYNAFSFIAGHVVLDSIRLTEPKLRVERTADGWNLTHLIRARTPDPDEPKNRRPIEIGEIGVSNGTLMLDDNVVGTAGTIEAPSRIERLDASVGVTSDENELRVAINHVSLRAADPAFGVNAVSGTIRRRENTLHLDDVSFRSEETSLRVTGSVQNIEGGAPVVDLQVTSDKFDTEEIGRLVPALRGYRMQPAFEVSAKGPADRMAVDVNFREQNVGQAKGSLTVDSEAPGRRIAGTVTMEHLNVGPLAKSQTLKSDITGTGQIDLALPEGRLPLSGTYAVTASSVDVAGYRAQDVKARGRIDGQLIRLDASAAAYGGRATAAGTIRAGQPLTLDLQGRAANLDLRNLPPSLNAPGVPSNLQFSYTLTGRGPVFSGDVRMEPSTLAGATIGDGTTGTFRVGGGAPEYSAKGQVTDLDVQQVGRGFGIAAISEDRYRSRINGTFDMSGSGGGRYPLTLNATGSLTDSEMFQANFPRFDFTTTLANGDMTVRSTGQFDTLNPEVVTGNAQLAADLSGDADVTTTIRGYADGVTVDDIDLAGRVNLANTSVRGFAINSGVIDGTFANREGQLTQLSLVGPDVTIQAQGPIALNETGSSNLTLHVETPALAKIGELVNQPLQGAALIDATVTGNATSLRASGTLNGSNIGHGSNSALALDTTFDVTVPNLTVADATVKAHSMATFLEVGGQKINEFTADTTYAMDAIQFDATAKQGVRELQAGGSVVLHPDHQEVHVRNLALRSEMIQWTTAPGSEATVQYGSNRVQVNNLALVSGDQRITADGVFGSPSESLRVQVENVDVAQIDALFLGDQRIAGRLSANAVVSGTTDAPRVTGDFSMAPGSFREFKFESFGGKVDYAGTGVVLDVRLQQTPQAWLSAKGSAPLTLFRGNPPEMVGMHTAASPGEAVDLEITSSEIDLGVVQGFTSYLTNVVGTLQANIRVTGSGYDPHFNGAIEIRGGAFEVPELGTKYTGLDTRMDLMSDALTINEMRILDAHQNPLTIGGTLGVHERNVGAVNIALQSHDFEVIDNELGRLNLANNLKLTGTLRAPRLEGSIDVEGTVDVAQVLMRATSDAYATQATSLGPARSVNAAATPATPGTAAAVPPPAGAAAAAPVAPVNSAPPAPTTPDTPSIFDSLSVNVGVGIPSTLVLNGRNIRPVNAPIDVGDMSVAVGGALGVRKAPGGQVEILGEVNTVRGSYTFQGRRFDIERDGRIRFQGGEELDPILDIRARRTIAAVDAVVRIQGTMRQPQLSFSSNPPLDEADILSLIIFGQSVNELGEGEQVSLAQRASALAGGYLASGLATSIGNALNLDEFQIQAAGDQGGGPEVTVGEQIGNNLFFRLRQGFGSVQATELILEYQIKEYLRLQATGAETQGGTGRISFRRIERGGIDLLFFFNY